MCYHIFSGCGQVGFPVLCIFHIELGYVDAFITVCAWVRLSVLLPHFPFLCDPMLLLLKSPFMTLWPTSTA